MENAWLTWLVVLPSEGGSLPEMMMSLIQMCLSLSQSYCCWMMNYWMSSCMHAALLQLFVLSWMCHVA